jgi:hypothetical protein
MHGRYAMWSSLVDVGCCDRGDALAELGKDCPTTAFSENCCTGRG